MFCFCEIYTCICTHVRGVLDKSIKKPSKIYINTKSTGVAWCILHTNSFSVRVCGITFYEACLYKAYVTHQKIFYNASLAVMVMVRVNLTLLITMIIQHYKHILTHNKYIHNAL